MIAWTTSCTSTPLPFRRGLAAPSRLRYERLRERDVLREDRVQLPVRPLDQQVAALRFADRVPPEVPLDRRPGSLVERRDDRLVVQRVDLLRDGLDDLTNGIRLRGPGVDRLPRAAVRLEVRLHEARVSRRALLWEPVAGAEDPVDVLRAHLARELRRIVRPVREEEELTAEIQLDHRLDLRVRVVALRAADDGVRMLRRDLLNDRSHVGGLGRVDSLEDGLDTRFLEERSHAISDRRRERVVERGVGRSLGPRRLR